MKKYGPMHVYTAFCTKSSIRNSKYIKNILNNPFQIYSQTQVHCTSKSQHQSQILTSKSVPAVHNMMESGIVPNVLSFCTFYPWAVFPLYPVSFVLAMSLLCGLLKSLKELRHGVRPILLVQGLHYGNTITWFSW